MKFKKLLIVAASLFFSGLLAAQNAQVISVFAEFKSREFTSVSMNISEKENHFYDYAIIRVHNILKLSSPSAQVVGVDVGNHIYKPCKIIAMENVGKINDYEVKEYSDVVVKFDPVLSVDKPEISCRIHINGTHALQLEGKLFLP